LKIEVGKYYKTRGGYKAYVSGKSPFKTSRPFTVLYEISEYSTVAAENGSTLLADSKEISCNDLIAPWPEEKSVEVWVWLYNHGAVIENYRAPTPYEREPVVNNGIKHEYVIGAVKLTGKVVEGVFE
jgi:hypothetical protein